MTLTLFSLDNTHEVCDSALVRWICGAPSSPVWRSHRSRVGIRKHAHGLTVRQAFLVWVSWNLCRNGRRRLTKAKVCAAAQALLEQADADSALDCFTTLTGVGGIAGRDVPQAIEMAIGYRPSISTLYRAGRAKGMPQFSMDEVYTAKQIRRFIGSIDKSGRKAA
jgi:hypothetical protein